MSWTVKRGDYGMQRTMTITNSDGTTKNLSGLTPTLKVWDGGGDYPSVNASGATIVFTAGLTVTSATSGTVAYTFQSGDTFNIVPATYSAEIKLTATSYKESSSTFSFIVNPSTS